MKVKFITNNAMAFGRLAYVMGEEATLADAQAEALIEAGICVKIEEQAVSDLPEGIPHRNKLAQAGLSASDLQGITTEDLLELPGIGPKASDEIMKFLNPES